MERADLVIVGGGAAGLAAAVMAGQAAPNSRIVLLEKGARVGKKLLATGNGTCNISHQNASVDSYHGGGAQRVRDALARFSWEEACRFFRSIGVETTVREDGRIYPLCTSAAAVLDCLRIAAANHADIRCESAVTALRPTANGVTVCTADGEIAAGHVLVAVGGAASPSCGGSSDGYRLLTDLGHTRTPLFPSIVQLRTDTRFVRAVKGLRVDGTVSLMLNGHRLASHTGEILFAEYGLSGPAVMQISRAAGEWERRKQGTLTAVVDLLPTISADELSALLSARREALATTPLEDFLTGLFQRRIGQTVLRMAGALPLDRRSDSLTDRELSAVVCAIKEWALDVTGTQGFGGAQVTAGGVTVTEFDENLISRRCPHVSAAGEVLDVDGDCGGYNLQWAWSSAATAVEGWRKKR